MKREYTKKNIRHIVGIGILSMFVVFSCFFICTPLKKPESDYRSSSLRKRVIESDSAERTEYYDYAGSITVAADLGYACKLITKLERAELEEYFDSEGLPISRYSNYYAVLREYDENGNNYKITYLDENKNPCAIANGYAIEFRSFDDKGRIKSVKYLDENGKPVCTSSYGFGKNNEFSNEGKISKITYINQLGMPMITGLGYASVIREFYSTKDQNNGQVECEFYLDEIGHPIQLSLGQYGVHKEYDDVGHVTSITYLDEEGEPIITNKGYTTIVRTFHADDSIDTERYYDINGYPFRNSEGQYGIHWENGHTTYLDAEGKEQFNIKNMLYSQSYLVVLLAMFVVAISNFISKKGNLLLFVLYAIAIAYMTLLYREKEDYKVDINILLRVKQLFTNSGARSDILKNVWLFIPLGSVLFQISRKRLVLTVPVALSICIEMIQYFTGSGFCELMDVASNSLGGLIGFVMSSLLKNVWTESKTYLARTLCKRHNTAK